MLVAGPGVSRPGWYRIRIGATFEEMAQRLLKSENGVKWRIIRGDLFTGEGIAGGSASVSPFDTEINVIGENDERELWRFMRPGFRYDSYPIATVADVVPILSKQLDSSLHGGVRPCVQCNYCDEVCPVGIYPHLIWKLMQINEAAETFRYRPFDCVGCGLCDYVCPSKISLSVTVTKAAAEYRNTRRSDAAPD
jgi:Na+-transporting NADH:ubiquinone oxidoreductase subunit NqrA